MTPSRRRFLATASATAGVAIAGCLALDALDDGPPGLLRQRWETEEPTEYVENHHRMAAPTGVDPVVVAPVNDHQDRGGPCRLLALEDDADTAWDEALPGDRCNVHAIGDLLAADVTGDGADEIVSSEEDAGVVVYDGATGEVMTTLSHDEWHGYGTPAVADIDADGTREIVAVDNFGEVIVGRPDGEVLRTDHLTGSVWAPPLVAPFTGGETPEVAIAQGGLEVTSVTVFGGDGSVEWERPMGALTTSWAALQDGGTADLVVPMRNGTVVRLDGATGERQWTESLPETPHLGEVHAGRVYLGVDDGTVVAVSAADGSRPWEMSLDAGEAGASPPTLAEVRPSGEPALAVASDDGAVHLLDVTDGAVLARDGGTDVGVHVDPVAVDLDGDGVDELLVLLGDGRVRAYEYLPP